VPEFVDYGCDGGLCPRDIEDLNALPVLDGVGRVEERFA
jgi:hypothetical protein